jgi:predicted RNA-binding Zn ribbon-like protein
MERNTSIGTLRIVGGNPALDFANTVSARRGRFGPDRLATWSDLRDWSLRVGVLDPAEAASLAPDGAEAAAALARAKRLREAIYRVFSAVAAGATPPADDLGLLGRMAGRAQAARRLEARPGGGAWAWGPPDHDAPALRVAHDAAELLVTAPKGRIRECFGPNCGWLFLDTSRNGSRRWCSEAECGTATRVARHRARVRGAEHAH